MKRKDFIYTAGLGVLGLTFPTFIGTATTHIISLSFDDGFKKSFYKTAEIHEEYGLKACFNVIASGHLKSFNQNLKWIRPELLGSFDDWNKLKNRGHEINLHTWEHLDLTKISIEKAKQNIDKCLNYFDKHLEGFSLTESVYNFAYNASTIELEDYLLEKVRAVRTGGWLVLNDTMYNPIPVSDIPYRLGCWSQGPDICDNFVEQKINKFLDSNGGWLILNVHGLDNEGWGPLSSNYLNNLLKRLTKINSLKMLPTGEVLKKYVET